MQQPENKHSEVPTPWHIFASIMCSIVAITHNVVMFSFTMKCLHLSALST